MIARTFEERRQAQQIRIFRHVPRLTPASAIVACLHIVMATAVDLVDKDVSH